MQTRTHIVTHILTWYRASIIPYWYIVLIKLIFWLSTLYLNVKTNDLSYPSPDNINICIQFPPFLLIQFSQRTE